MRCSAISRLSFQRCANNQRNAPRASIVLGGVVFLTSVLQCGNDIKPCWRRQFSYRKSTTINDAFSVSDQVYAVRLKTRRSKLPSSPVLWFWECGTCTRLGRTRWNEGSTSVLWPSPLRRCRM